MESGCSDYPNLNHDRRNIMKLFGNVCYTMGIVVAIGVGFNAVTLRQTELTRGADCWYFSIGKTQCSTLGTTCIGEFTEINKATSGMTITSEYGNQCGNDNDGCTVKHKDASTGCGG